ncbi:MULTISPECIES: hypothetical protein [Methylobacterium]|jgi:hypothetical protein|uniref:Uncharacterized protein n=2 Tax=Methylobacterium TaxID=407 RepID=A0A0C6FNR1_9HYPH|nr:MULTISPECIES: hypothetical protein [Methylobacterium]MBK3396567.1 hypothetical protein [Methylobacterium ajmalii]MBK3409216.1 hypothetical protein [Methylobacterium ajmalii]MBZ6412931.1 hypothetical protein [Methylobacterium sp.]SFE97031.1 hypothetical protein SAMN04487844_108126 [Methylobacterium sp. yr596]BAQ44235.1 conserved hypothetical protein [Methylobacterium aquaticum]
MPSHPTLDAELVVWWECEAARLESLAASARFGFTRRHYARKAAAARARAQVSRLREQAREPAPRPAIG